MKITFQPRRELTRLQSIVILLCSLGVGFVLVGCVFILKGVNPFYAIYSIFKGSFGSFYGIKETITKAIPLILIGCGLTLAFQGKFWNIGAEGQLILGAVFSTWIALNIGPHVPAIVAIPLMMIGAFIGGALWAFIPAILKVRFGINEVISTLMFNYISFEIVKFLIIGPWKGATKSGYPYTDDFPASSVIKMLPGSRIHLLTLIVALFAAVILFLLIYKTRFGYEVRVIGENPDAARYAGISYFKTAALTMVISGGIAGLAGMGEVAGIHHHLTYPENISAGYGFTAIIVAWLAGLNPLLVLISGIFFAGITVGGDAIQISLNLPAVTVDVFNGILLFALIVGEYFRNHKLIIEGKK